MKFYANFSITAESILCNRAINYGDGVFETILVVNQSIPLWKFHYQRLQSSCVKLNLKGVEENQLFKNLTNLVPDNQTYSAKIVVFRSGDKRTYQSRSVKSRFFISLNQLTPLNASEQLCVSPIKLSGQKQLAGIKHLNRLEQVLAANELCHSKYDDALMLHKNHIIETISKNIVLIKGNDLLTPKLDKCGVHGVALRWLESQGYNLKWKKIELKSLAEYDGLMTCNSLRGFNAVSKINNDSFDKDLPVIKEIQLKWQKQINLK